MIYLFHGDEVVKSRAAILIQQKKLGVDKRHEFDIKNDGLADFFPLTSAQTLFGEIPFIVLNVTNALKNDITSLINHFEKSKITATIVLFSEKSLPKTNDLLKWAESADTCILKSEKVPTADIFRFLDALFSRNKQQAYKEYLNLLSDGKDEYLILSMIFYEIKNELLVAFPCASSDTLKPYSKAKASAHLKSLFTTIENSKKGVCELIGAFYDTELAMKTGTLLPDTAIPFFMEKVLNLR